ncbi:MAG: L-arabinose isomerase [Rhodobacteraceae bacterium]|nr:L-arabinose isomerase [Paracoccaceae bacterium]
MMLGLKPMTLWFVVGTQNLYGAETLAEVARNAETIAAALNTRGLPVEIKAQPIVKTPGEATDICTRANSDPECGGVILWMHTFSPSKMWIRGLSQLTKPLMHLHTQFNRELPWSEIDMNYMNTHQAAHGDREAGFIHTRMRLARKVVVGHWSDRKVHDRIDAWARAARAWHDWQGGKIVRIGDNMRQVAVTDGDRVSAEMAFGFTIDTFGVGDLVAEMAAIPDARVADLAAGYCDLYDVAPDLAPGGSRHEALRHAARQELGLRKFLGDRGAMGMTHTFEDLHGLDQLPGFAPQRLMADGIGHAGEGDWRTSALVRALKVMGHGLSGATSFMEDYTYDLTEGQEVVLGSHMLEICPTIASGKPRVEIHPLGIGGKSDPVRLVFDAVKGDALNASLIDLGNRFRLVVNAVEAVDHPDLPKLPVARTVWRCKPDFATACAAWIHAGGAHHTAFSHDVTTEVLTDFATIAGIEMTLIDDDTRLPRFLHDLRLGEVYYHIDKGFRA